MLLADPDRLLHGAEERLRQFRYFTFEPSIDLDEAILVDFIRRAADLALLPAARDGRWRKRAFEPLDAAAMPADIEVELVDLG